MYRFLLLSIVFLNSFWVAKGQEYELTGSVWDENELPMAYVGVYIENSSIGTVTNQKGRFSLMLPTGKHIITFQFVGYTTQKLEVNITGDKELNVQLQLAQNTTPEVEIKADREDPAIRVIKGAIENRKQNQNALNSYKCNAYIKAVLEIDSTLKRTKLGDSLVNKEKVNLIESKSTVFFKNPDKYKEIKHSYSDYSEKGNVTTGVQVRTGDDFQQFVAVNPNLFFTNVNEGNFDFYKNLIDLPALSDRPYVSPIGNSALLAYKFHFVESFYEQGAWVNRIEVSPRNQAGNLFKGEIFIEDSTYRIRKFNFVLSDLSLRYFDHFQIIQDYQGLNIDRQEFFYHVKQGRKATSYGHTTVVYDSFENNIEIDDRFFRGAQVVYDQDAYEKDTNYWNEIRPMKLSFREVSYIQQQDSIDQYEKTEEYLRSKDSAYNHINFWSFVVNGVGHRNSFTGWTFFFDPILSCARPLAPGGYRQGIRGDIIKKFEKDYALALDYEVNYGFRNENVKGRGRLKYTYNPKKFAKVGIGGGNHYTLINNLESFQAILSRSNYAEKTYVEASHESELTNGLYLSAETHFAEFKAIKGLELAPWSQEVFGANNNPQDFTTYNEWIFHFKLKFVPFQKFVDKPYSKEILKNDFPVFTLDYHKGVNTFGSVVNFDRLDIGITDDLQLLNLGTSKWAVYFGRFLNTKDVRIADQKFFRGSDPLIFAPPLNFFQYLGPSFSTTKGYFEGHFFHHFHGIFMNKIPLIKHLKLESVAGANVMMLEENNFLHGEFYVGLERVYRIKKQLFKLSAFYVTAQNAQDGFTSGFKVGLDFFNPFTNSWSY